ncbi:MAG TPA: hypothetical protein V6C81_19885 [Planktothrix sp.]|jgi:hypothetical protein
MPNEDGRQISETQKALLAAQTLFEQGNRAAAAPIFANILSQVDEDSAEAALCLSNLSDIHEFNGDIRSAIDYSIKLIHHPTQQKSAAIVAAHTERAAEMLTQLGETSEADKLREEIARMQQGERELMHGVPDQDEEAPAWLMHALKNAAYRCLERAGRSRAERSTREQQEQSRTASDLTGMDAASALEEWHHTTSDMLSRLGQMFPTQSNAAESAVHQPRPNAGPHAYTQTAEEPALDASSSPPARRIEMPEEALDSDSAAAIEQDSAKAGIMDVAYNVGAKISSAKKESEGAPNIKSIRPLQTDRAGTAANSLRAAEAGGAPPMPGMFDMLYSLGAKFSFLKSPEPDFGRPQEIEEERPQQKASVGLAIVVIAIVAFIAAWNLIPRAGNPVHEYAHSDHQFKDASQDKMVSLLSPAECELRTGQETKRVKLCYYFGDWRDVLTIMFGQPHSHSYFLRRLDNVLLDPSGTELFVADSPEIQLCERCQLMMQDVNSYFEDHKAYPPKFESMQSVDWSYENPYTQDKQKEHPAIAPLTFGAGSTDQEVDDERADFYEKVSGEKFWDVQHIMRPGQIRCFNAIFKSSRGNINAFVIGVADSKGKVINGDQPQSAFCLISEDGKQKPIEAAKLPDNVVVWMAEKPLDFGVQNMIENGAAWVLGFIAILTVFMALSPGQPKRKKAFLLLISAIFAASAVFYFVWKR